MSELVDITIESKTGALYVLPDVSKTVMDKTVPALSHWKTTMSSFTLENISGAVLLVPWRIINRILMDNQEVWIAPP